MSRLELVDVLIRALIGIGVFWVLGILIYVEVFENRKYKKQQVKDVNTKKVFMNIDDIRN